MFIGNKFLLSGVIRKSTVAEKDRECTSKTIDKLLQGKNGDQVQYQHVGAMDGKFLQNQIK